MNQHSQERPARTSGPRPPRGALAAALVVGSGLAAWWVAAQPIGPPPAADGEANTLVLERVADDLEHPVHLTAPAGDPRLFIVEQFGLVKIWKNGRILPRPFIDLRRRISMSSERGLLSIAFHPRYAKTGSVYVSYTDLAGDTRIERWRVSRNPDIADPASAALILRVEQPYSNHNGGLVAFGPDGMLYVGLGDGGSAGDPHDHAQRLRSLLGKLLRLDVDGGRPYAIPRDNPFVGREDARPEIWAWGLRNPWRFSWDRPSKLLFIGDVGQDRWEEIDVAPTARAGANYGWNRMEGKHAFRTGPGMSALVRPAVEYPSSEGCTVIGGHVYRGERHPSLSGHYFYADHCRSWIRSFRWDDGQVVDHRTWSHGRRLQPTSFGVDGFGELYVLSLTGEVYRLGARRPPARDTTASQDR